MKVHAFYLLKKGGIPVYHRVFSKELKTVDTTLLSSFVTAIGDFSRMLVNESLDVIDIGPMRLFLQQDEKGSFIAMLITSSDVSVLLIRERVKLLLRTFFTMRDQASCLEEDCIVEGDERLDKAVDDIVNLHDSYSEQEILPIKAIIESETRDGEIVAGGLLSLQGEIYFSNLPSDYLHQALREVEIRAQADTGSLKVAMPKLIWQAGSAMMISQVVASQTFGQPVVICLLFDANTTNPGMADFELESLYKKLQPLL